MDKSDGGFSNAKRHLNKQQSRPELQFSEKSKKEKVRSLSAVAKALSTYQMGCRVSPSQKPNATATKKFKLPRKFLTDSNGVGHASVPRKIRSAMKKRGRESILTESEKGNHKLSDKESAAKDGIKKSKKQRSKGWSTNQVLAGPITKDEEEVVETLYAMAGMFPDNASNSGTQLNSESSLPLNSPGFQDQEENQSANATIELEASGTTQDAGERSPGGCDQINSLNDAKTNGEEQADLPESEKFLVPNHSTIPNINLQALPTMAKSENGGKVALHDTELSLEMGLNVSTQLQISRSGRQSDLEFQTARGIGCNQEQHIIKYQKETEGPALWPSLSLRASAGISASYLQSSSAAKAPDWLSTAICPSKQDLMESCSSGVKKKAWKRCAVHVHISHLIRSLDVPKSQAGKEPELYECHQMKAHQGSKCEVPMEAHSLNWMRNENTYAAGTVHSVSMRNSNETKNGVPQQQGHYQDMSQASPTPGVYGPQKQSFNFLSLSTGGNELKVNETFNKSERKLDLLSKSQAPYFQSLQQQHGLMPIHSQYASTSFLDQLPVAGPQVRLQQPHYYGTPLRGTHYSSPLSYKQQQQSFWAVQLATQGGSAVNCSIVRAQYPNWQSGRHATNPCPQMILPHSHASLEAFGSSKITSVSDQQLFTLGSSLNPSSRSRANGLDIYLPSSVCEESKGRFRSSSGTPSLQLLCDERI
ncbi:hypothetical protein RJT34_08782 [Clitoria ternatea]|uniref:Uncharacterized protein n=1 Tax=Clitoria ternatea TaxID=43366 RepID=A0AAN9K696_CLITE